MDSDHWIEFAKQIHECLKFGGTLTLSVDEIVAAAGILVRFVAFRRAKT